MVKCMVLHDFALGLTASTGAYWSEYQAMAWLLVELTILYSFGKQVEFRSNRIRHWCLVLQTLMALLVLCVAAVPLFETSSSIDTAILTVSLGILFVDACAVAYFLISAALSVATSSCRMDTSIDSRGQVFSDDSPNINTKDSSPIDRVIKNNITETDKLYSRDLREQAAF